MILVVVVELVIDVDWFLHECGHDERESAVDLIGGANVVVVYGDLHDVTRKDHHRNPSTQKNSRHDEEEDNGFGESGDRQPGFEHLLLKRLDERTALFAAGALCFRLSRILGLHYNDCYCRISL